MTQPLTAFEVNGGTAWTTLAEEATFLAALAADSAVTYAQVGHSVYGKPLHLVRVGAGPTPVLVTALQHGNEPAGREMVLQTIRNLAYTTDPNLLDFLDQYTLHVIPTCNPDGFPTYRTSPGGGGLEVQDAHINLAIPEAVAIQTAIRDVQPAFTMDAHEHFATDPARQRLEFASVTTLQAHPDAQTAGQSLLAHIYSRAAADGIPAGGYTPLTSHPPTLRTTAALRHAVSLLMETPALGDAVAFSTRVAWQLAGMRWVIDWLLTNDVAAVRQASIAAAPLVGARAAAPFDLGNGTVLSPPPVGYQLDPAAVTAFALHAATFDIDVDTDGIVTMAQSARGLLPYLLDPAAPGVPLAPGPVVAATRIAWAPVLDVRVSRDEDVVTPDRIIRVINGEVIDVPAVWANGKLVWLPAPHPDISP